MKISSQPSLKLFLNTSWRRQKVSARTRSFTKKCKKHFSCLLLKLVSFSVVRLVQKAENVSNMN